MAKWALGLVLSLALSAATVDGLKIHSAVHGAGTKTVILVHGWTCDETTWSEQVPVLAKKYRVVTLDLPGHGKSEAPKDGRFSMDLFARAVEAVRVESQTDRVVLVGHSMGTTVVVRYAHLYPQHTAALVFVDGVTAGNPNRQRRTGEMMAGPDGRKNREAMIQGMFTQKTPPSVRTKVLDMMLSAPEATAAGALDATLAATSGDEGRLDIPVLAVYADHSRLANSEYLHGHYSHLEYTEIPGTGHFLMLEKPKELNRVLLTFLDSVK
ncbi:MAG TPA: alpha/beta hydrolase [Bryobacteraceae bacterium]|nr:alpha/beta hydrolase [Bryobacteraceae bacterium]